MISGRRLFQTEAAATRKTQLLMVDSCMQRTISDSCVADADEHQNQQVDETYRQSMMAPFIANGCMQ